MSFLCPYFYGFGLIYAQQRKMYIFKSLFVQYCSFDVFHFERHSLSMTFALHVFYSPPSITLESCFRRLMIRLLPLWFIVKTTHLEWEGEGVKTVNGNPSRHNPSKLFHLSLFPRWSVMVWYKCCALLLPLIQWGCCHSKWGKERTEFFFLSEATD